MALFRSCKFKMKNDMRGAACEVPAKRTCGTRKAGLRRAKLQIQNSEFKIQNLKGLSGALRHISQFGSQPAECSPATIRSSGPPPPGGCGPHDLYRGRFQSQAISPQPSGGPARAAYRREYAALRPGAAVGCSTSPTSNLQAGIFFRTSAAAGCGGFLRSRKLKMKN